MTNKATTYRLPETTTPENLECGWNCVLNFGSKVLLAGHFYSGRNQNSYYGAVYEYTTDDHYNGAFLFTVAPGTYQCDFILEGYADKTETY